MRTLERGCDFLPVHVDDPVRIALELRIGILREILLDVVDTGNPDVRH
jgi:hypothetical protein